jgi:predicted dehydrogenase
MTSIAPSLDPASTTVGSARRTMPRRSFLKGTAAVTAASMVTPRLLFAAQGQAAPLAKVNLACVGIGNRGAEIIKALNATGQANLVAFCDTDMGAKHTRAILNQFPQVPRFQDFRKMFDQMGKEIDAICVGTPDHSHFPVTMLAMSLGKHVYVEKPLAHSYHEIDLMMRAEKKYQVAAQMGNQGHSDANYFQFEAWVRAGIIKNVTRITAYMNNARRWHGMRVYDYLNEEPTPDTLDWEGWLTSAQFRPYNTGYINGEWRSWFAFGNGALGDWGAHIFDTAHQFLDLGMPSEVDPVKLEGHSDFLFPQASTLAFRFPTRGNQPPLELTWYDGVDNLPPLPADLGAAVVDPNIPPPSTGQIDTKKYPPGKVIYGEGLTFKGGSHGSTLEIIPKSKAEDLKSKLPEVPKSPSNHFLNFLRACRGEETCRSNFAVAGPLCQMMALGIIAQRLNRKIEFDRQTAQITNDKLANDLLVGPPPRKGWEEFYRL